MIKQDKQKRCVVLTIAALLCMGSLAGCSSSVPFLSGNDEVKQKIVTSKDIKIPIESMVSFNPVNSKEESVYYINQLIYEGLFRLDDTLKAVPVLASGYVYDQKEASVTVTLQNGIKWHDGTVFDATDVKYSIDAYLSAYYANTSLYRNLIGKIKSAKVRGNNSITIYFKSNKDMAIENLTFPILPSGQFKKAETLRSATGNFKPIGTGPYMVSSLDKVKGVTLEGYQGYHGTVPTNRIIFKLMPDQASSTKLFAINDLAVSFSKDIDRDTYLNSKDVTLGSFPSNEIELVGFNVNKQGLADKKVRKALTYAIDSEEILDTGYFKSGMLNDNLYYPGYLGVESQKKVIGFDLDKAKKRLEDAGYTDADGNGFVEDKDGNELSVNILINSENPSRIVAAQTIKESLNKLFIHSEVQQREWNAYNSAIAGGDYDIFIGGYKVQDTFDLRFLLHSGYNNPAGYSNTTLDFLLDKMQSGIGEAERLETYQSIRKITKDEMPYYCMFYKTYGVISSPSLKGEVSPRFFNLYNGCENWYCEYLEQEKK